MGDGDVVVFMNFRADRAREITRALTDPDVRRLSTRARVPQLGAYVCLTSYGDEFAHLPVAFGPQTIRNSFGEYIASLGLTQLRIAETEKYAHVTYFFNGGVEAVYPGEDRILVPSPKVATYDLKPEMSAPRGDRQAGRGHRVAASTTRSSATTPTATWSATPATSRPRSRRSRRSTTASAAWSRRRAPPAARC